MSETKISIFVVLAVAVLGTAYAVYAVTRDPYPQATGIFPQVISCVPEHEPERHTGPNWQPTLRVTVEPVRDPGRVREYRVLGCRLYYYHRYFR
jgi:hypothetical protein